MPEAISEQLWDVGRVLLLCSFVSLAYEEAKRTGEKNGRLIGLKNGLGSVLAIAVFATLSMGGPSCEEAGDPLRGGCSQYADDGYDPTWDQRTGNFLFWGLLLGVPVVMGVMQSRRYEANPWRRPEANGGPAA